MKKFIWDFLFVLIVICLYPNVTIADDAAFSGYGADVFPVAESDIKLEYELLTINYQVNSRDRAEVEALFVFKNEGKAKTVVIGFPEALGSEPAFENIPTIFDFKTSIDGRPWETVHQPLQKRNEEYAFDRVYLWKVHFKAGETHVIRNSYYYRPTVWSTCDWRLEYILKTGALWAGPIGKIDIIVKSQIPVPWMEFMPYPEEYSYFQATNWEPDRNIVLSSHREADSVIFNKGKVSGYFGEKKSKEIYRTAMLKRQKEIRDYIGKLTPEKLSICSKNQIQTYINGIYASYGWVFKSSEWTKFFNEKWWYQPNPNFKETDLTPDNQKVLARLKDYLVNAINSVEIKMGKQKEY